MEQTKEKKPKKLTKKQRGFVADYVKSENGTQAALKNYDTSTEHSAAVIASENLTKPEIVEAIEIKRKSLKEALFDEGIDEKYLAQKVNVLLKADDPNAIDKGLKHALNIHGVGGDGDKPSSNNTYNFLFSAETQADIRQIEDKIKAKLVGNDIPKV